MAKVKVTREQREDWLGRIHNLRREIGEIECETGSPLEEAYYALGEAINRLRDVRIPYSRVAR